ncbi:Proteolipid membrane potential modulator [Teratosphaeria destructans]|uniref:Proteolipid membrane potential modulator n=1 Tax=Teratosphaeria destructans TaxID=418781 RepID=A0A9W7W571_9PEZI|nr:Proteolipid membrane potential modulator [Teratosphaeria destructans]
MTLGGLTLAFVAIFLPPLPVLIRAGCGTYFLLSIILLFLGWIPAILFAWFVIIDKPGDQASGVAGAGQEPQRRECGAECELCRAGWGGPVELRESDGVHGVEVEIEVEVEVEVEGADQVAGDDGAAEAEHDFEAGVFEVRGFGVGPCGFWS